MIDAVFNYDDYDVWYYRCNDCSPRKTYTWGGARNWNIYEYNYGGRVTFLQYLDDLLLSDVFQMDFNGYGEPFQALRSGQASAVVLDHASFQSQADDLGDVATVGNPMDYNPKADWKDAEAKAPYIFGTMAMGIRPECSDLEQAVNQALADMEKDGTRKAILSKYHMWNDGQAVLMK